MTTSALGCAAAAMASFELMYLPDAATGKITRYDPINKIVLGSFGYPDLVNPFVSVAGAEGPSDRVYAASQLGTRVFDPNSGIVYGAYQNPYYTSRCSASGRYLFSHSGSNFANRYDVTSFNPGALVSSLTTIMDTLPISDTVAWNFGVDAAGNLAMQRADFGAGTQGSLITLMAASVMGGSTARIGMATRYVTSTGTIRYAIPAPTASNFQQIFYVTMNSAETGYVGTGSLLLSGFATASALSTLAGHDGFYVIGDDTSSLSTTRVDHYDSLFYSTGAYTTTAFNVPSSRWGGVNVMAPEPASFWLVGLGLVGVALRRRR